MYIQTKVLYIYCIYCIFYFQDLLKDNTFIQNFVFLFMYFWKLLLYKNRKSKYTGTGTVKKSNNKNYKKIKALFI